MRKVIRGRRYDTARAKLIARAVSLDGPLHRWIEYLYQTSHGRWFVRGAGGPLSRWGLAATDGTCTEGEGIRPLTPAQAQLWLEQTGCDHIDDD